VHAVRRMDNITFLTTISIFLTLVEAAAPVRLAIVAVAVIMAIVAVAVIMAIVAVPVIKIENL
jgi:hypothetical protein